MAANAGKSKPEYKPEQKAEIVERVCLLYGSQNVTLESCCETVGISKSAFYLWIAENGEFGERYKKAKAKQDAFYWDLLREKGKTSLERLVEGEERVEVKEEGANINGAFVLAKKTTTTTKILPNATAVIFAMKGEYPERFVERQEITGKDGGAIEFSDTSALTIEEKRALLKLTKARGNASTDTKHNTGGTSGD